MRRTAVSPEVSDFSFSGMESIGAGTDADYPGDAVYQQQDARLFLNQPSIKKALDL